MKCPETTQQGRPCPNPLSKWGADPDGVHRCVHHSRDPRRLEMHRLKGLAGKLTARARDLLEIVESAPVDQTEIKQAADPAVDLSSPESVRKTLEAALREARGKVTPAEYVKLANGAARALRGDGGKNKSKDAPTTPREIRHVVVHTREQAKEVEREQQRADGVLDEEEEPRAAELH